MYPKNYWEINTTMYNTCLFKVSEMEHISSGKHQNRIHVTCLHVQTIKRMRRTQKNLRKKRFPNSGRHCSPCLYDLGDRDVAGGL